MKSLRFIFVALLFSMALDPLAYGAESVSTKTDHVKFDLIDNRIFVDVFLNGQGPFKFIFDTGGNNSMTHELAKKLSLPVEDAGDGSGAGNDTQSMGRTKVGEFRVGAIDLKDQSFLVLDYSKIQKSFDLPALDGVFGYEILKEYLTLIDFQKGQMTFHSNPVDFDSNEFEKIGFELFYDKPFLKTKISGLTANTLIDTGDRSALTVTKRFRKNKRIDHPFSGKPEVISGYGIGGPILAKVSALGVLKLTSSSSLFQVATRAPTAKGGFNAMKDLDASIGNEVLKQFNVAFDYRNRRIFFQKNRFFGQPTKFTEVPNPQ